MWKTALGYTLAGGQTFINFGEARLYHDAANIYVYIRNDKYYGSNANIKFDVKSSLSTLGSTSDKLNNQKVPVSSSTPPGTEFWLKSSFSCWDLPNSSNNSTCKANSIYVSIHIDAST